LASGQLYYGILPLITPTGPKTNYTQDELKLQSSASMITAGKFGIMTVEFVNSCINQPLSSETYCMQSETVFRSICNCVFRFTCMKSLREVTNY